MKMALQQLGIMVQWMVITFRDLSKFEF